jgi:hypothetical protein
MLNLKIVGERPVGVDELKDAILRCALPSGNHMIVEKFGDRPLSWENATLALSLASSEIIHKEK